MIKWIDRIIEVIMECFIMRYIEDFGIEDSKIGGW